MASEPRATLAGIAAILLWAALASLTAATAAIPPLQLLACSFAIAALLGGGVLGLRGGLRASLAQPWPALLLTTLALGGYHALYFFALQRAPVVEANLVNYLWPLLIVLFAALAGAGRVRSGHVLGALLGLVAAILVVTRGEAIRPLPAFLPGYLAALAAAVVWAAYSVLNRRFAAVPSEGVVVACAATAVLGTFAHLAFETTVVPDARQALWLLAMGVGPVGAAFWLWDHGTKRGNLALLGTLSYATPLLSTLGLLLGGHAQPHWTQALAVLLLLAGGALGMRASRG